MDVNWESTTLTSLSFCVAHYRQIQRFLNCALCKRRLVRNSTFQLVAAEINELNESLQFLGIPVTLDSQKYVCKLCRYFTQLQLKFKDLSIMTENYKSFFKSYRIRFVILLWYELTIKLSSLNIFMENSKFFFKNRQVVIKLAEFK